MPRAGGVYVFLNEAYGGLFGFLYGWAYFLVVNTGGLAALSIAFATYLGYFIPLSSWEIKIAAILGLLVLTAINYFGVKPGGVFADIFTLLKIAGIVGVIMVGFTCQPPEAVSIFSENLNIPPNFWSAIAAAMVGVLWSCGGWQHVTYVAGEAKEQKRSIPFALILGTLGVMLLYIFTNIAYMKMMPVEQIAASGRVAADALQIAVGPVGAMLVSLVIFISVFGTAGIYTMTAPRIYYAMANDGVFFKKVAEIHPKYNVPTFAILFQTAWAIILILSGTFYELITYVAFTDWIFFALAGFSVFLFRRRQPERERPYKTLGYPLTPVFFVGVSAWFVINTLIGAPLQSLAGLGFLALGVPVYHLWRKARQG
jgi:APA family basic amino acid/polyamine antiporter